MTSALQWEPAILAKFPPTLKLVNKAAGNSASWEEELGICCVGSQTSYPSAQSPRFAGHSSLGSVVRSGHPFLVEKDGAEGGIRTHTPRGATPSRWCVCQFRHFRSKEG